MKCVRRKEGNEMPLEKMGSLTRRYVASATSEKGADGEEGEGFTEKIRQSYQFLQAKGKRKGSSVHNTSGGDSGFSVRRNLECLLVERKRVKGKEKAGTGRKNAMLFDRLILTKTKVAVLDI